MHVSIDDLNVHWKLSELLVDDRKDNNPSALELLSLGC